MDNHDMQPAAPFRAHQRSRLATGLSRFLLCAMLLVSAAPIAVAATVNVDDVAELASAINDGAAGDTINIAPGTYLLTSSLRPKANMTITGAGRDSTILRPAPSWTPGLATLVDPVFWNGVNTSAYMFFMGVNEGNNGVTISNLSMDGLKQLQGALCGNNIQGLTIRDVYFHDFTFCGVRIFVGSQLVVRDCEFINMAVPGMDPEAGAVVFAYVADSEFYNNRIYFATRGVYYGPGVNAGNFYGFKGRQLINSRIHHNTIMVNFSVELPFDDNDRVEIDHNYMVGWISMPKYAGGTVPASGVTCRIHHNYSSSAVVAEYPRNAVEIDHNLLDNPRNEAGSMLSGWTVETAQGSTKMHNNLIKNLGRVLADVGMYNNLQFYNNHVNAPLNDGATTNFLFIIDGNIDRSSFVFRDNIVDCTGHPRALLWAGLGAGFTSISNNTMINVTDQANYANPDTGAVRGPLEPLYFTCGAPNDQYLVDQWTITPIAAPAAPSSLIATAFSSSQINLAWTDNASNETGFKVERKIGASGTWSQIATPAANAVGFSDTGLAANTLYYYRVRASNASADSAFSNEAGATTPGIVVSELLSALGGPATVTAGSSVLVEVGYSAGAGRELVVDFKLSAAPSTIYSSQRVPLPLGSGTQSVSVGVPSSTPAGPGFSYLAYIVPTGGGWPDRVADREQSGVTVVVYTGDGSIAREVWSGISGTALSSIPLTTVPTISDTLSSFEGPSNWADNYGTRIRGYITAPITGSYTFWLATDDNGELWLSSNDQPSAKARIASVNGWTSSREWGKYASQKSAAITLTAGQRYYVEVLQKEGAGGDNLAVGWARPGEATTAPSQIIPGAQLSPFAGAPNLWQTADVGAVAAVGSATGSSAEAWTVTGSGADIWNTADEFRFVWRQLSGDVRITARVTGMGNTNAWAKAGVMLRESLAPGSRHASTFATASNGTCFQRRRITDATSGHTGGPAVSAPVWVRIERIGDRVTASTSPDGANWSVIRSETVTLGATIHAGLAVTSHSDGRLCTATFTDVEVVGAAAASN